MLEMKFLSKLSVYNSDILDTQLESDKLLLYALKCLIFGELIMISDDILLLLAAILTKLSKLIISSFFSTLLLTLISTTRLLNST